MKALSTVALVVTAAVWAASYVRDREILLALEPWRELTPDRHEPRECSGHIHSALVSRRGWAGYVRRVDVEKDVHLWSHSEWSMTPAESFFDERRLSFVPGIEVVTARRGFADGGRVVQRFGVSYWFLAVIFAALPAYGLIRRAAVHARRRRRNRGRVCGNCGYDLRATPDRCPECGAVPAGANGNAEAQRR